jgi:hypothetical protein
LVVALAHLEANDALSWKVPTPGLLSFDIRITNSSGWGVNAFDAAAYVDVLLVNKKNYDIYTLSTGAITVDHRYFFNASTGSRVAISFSPPPTISPATGISCSTTATPGISTAAGVDPGPSARPPRGRPSLLTVDYTVDYVVASAVTQLTAPCGLVTLNKSPNPAFYYRLTAGTWELQFGIDSCATGVAPVGNVTSGPCPLIYYILDRTNFDIINAGDFQTAVHDAAIQPPPSGARFALNVSAPPPSSSLFSTPNPPLSPPGTASTSSAKCAAARSPSTTRASPAPPPARAAPTAPATEACAAKTTPAPPAPSATSAARARRRTPAARPTSAALAPRSACQACARAAISAHSIAPRPNATDLWERCDANLRPLTYGNADVCLQCTRGDINCRCGAASVCSEPTNLCNATTDICVTDPSKATTTTTPVPTTAASGTDATTRFVVEPVETRGADPQPSSAAAAAAPIQWTLAIVAMCFSFKQI